MHAYSVIYIRIVCECALYVRTQDHIRRSQLKQNPFNKLSLFDWHARMRDQHKVRKQYNSFTQYCLQ